MAEQNLIVSKGNKHLPAEPGDTVPAAVIPLSSARNQGITVKADGLHVDTTNNVRVVRRPAQAGITVQIERCPGTAVQVVRITGTAASTLNNTPVSWDSHPFANKAIIFSGVSGDGVGSAQVANITTTGANITVPRSGPFHLKFEGNY